MYRIKQIKKILHTSSFFSIIHKNTRNITVDAELPVKHVYNVIERIKTGFTILIVKS